MTKATRKNITQPEDWWQAFEYEASRCGLTLSEWVGECCMAYLKQATQSRLSERTGRGKPKSDGTPNGTPNRASN